MTNGHERPSVILGKPLQPMTRLKAIEIIRQRLNTSADLFDPDWRDALELAIRALQLVENARPTKPRE